MVTSDEFPHSSALASACAFSGCRRVTAHLAGGWEGHAAAPRVPQPRRRSTPSRVSPVAHLTHTLAQQSRPSEKDTQIDFNKACDAVYWGDCFTHALDPEGRYKDCFDAKSPAKVRGPMFVLPSSVLSAELFSQGGEVKKGGGKPDGFFLTKDDTLVGIAELKRDDMAAAQEDLHGYAKTFLLRTPDPIKRLVGVAGTGSTSTTLELQWFLYDADVDGGEPQLLTVNIPIGQAIPPRAVYELYEVRCWRQVLTSESMLTPSISTRRPATNSASPKTF